MLPAMSTSSPRPYDEETNDDTSVSEAVVGASPILSTAAPTRSTPEIPAVDAQLSTPSHSPTPSQIATTSSRSSEPATGGAQPKAQPIPLIPHVAGTGMVVSPAAFRVSPVPIPPKHNLEDSDATRPESEKDIRSQRGSTGDQGSEGGGAGGSYYGTGARGQAGMPRNFRISVDGYTLLRDDDGTFAAYRINVTAGLHQWQVLRRYRQFLSLHDAVAEYLRPEDMPHLPGKRILGSSVDPSFAEARGLALQVYLLQLVRVSAAWQVPQLTGFLDERASMMGVQGQISDVLEHVDRMESLCVDLQHQLGLSQLQVQGQNALVETLCRRLQQVEHDYAVLAANSPPAPSPLSPNGDASGSTSGAEGAFDKDAAPGAGADEGSEQPPRRRASTGPTLTIPGQEPYFGAAPGFIRRMSTFGGAMGSAGLGGTSLPAASIDMSDLNNLVKRVESANQLAMKVASDDEDDAIDQLLEHQHQIMRSASAYSLVSNPEAGGQQRLDKRESSDFFFIGSIDTCGATEGLKGILDADGHDDGPAAASGSIVEGVATTGAAPITIPAPQGSAKVWERLRKGGTLFGDPEERMMAEGQDENTPGSGLVRDVSRSMFGLASPPCPPSAPRWPSAGLNTLTSVFGINGNNDNGVGGGKHGAHGGVRPTSGDGGRMRWKKDGTAQSLPPELGEMAPGPSEAEEDPLPLDILPGNRQPLAIDRRVDDLLRLLRPAPRAMRYRRSVFQFVTQQVKRSLGAKCFPVGGYAIQAYLPDEEVDISAFLCHGQEKSWFVRVNETLCKVSSEASEEAAEAEGDGGEKRPGGGGGGAVAGGQDGEDASSCYKHRLSNVNFINMGNIQRIKCVVDNQVAVDIGANQVGEIATVALLEHTDQMLGKNHLFKRSLLLIKSWWVYESRAYTGSNMLSRITEAALATMVLSVVNQHHARLHTPLQVMALFFHMHSRFDWSKYCWCIEGPRRLDTLHSNSRLDAGGQDGDSFGNVAEAFGGLAGHPAPLLLSQEVLNLYRVRHGGRGRQRPYPSGRKSPTAPPITGNPGEAGVVSGGRGGGAGTGSTGGSAVAAPGGGAEWGKEGVREEASRKFPVRIMNVMNPLDSSDNQIDDTVNRRRAARMHSLLQMGARQLRPVLMHLKREVTKAQQGQPGPPQAGYMRTTSVAMLETFFALSWARFGQGWRPDVPPHLDRDSGVNEKMPWSKYDHDNEFNLFGCGDDFANSLVVGRGESDTDADGEHMDTLAEGVVTEGNSWRSRDPFHVDLQSVRDSVKYCCFLLEAEVTDSALLALSKEILADKGSLPVGEIGKLLQEATANATLSQTLKDQFGGLKKFLEKYPGEFVIAADHPFNPHVYLKSTLTPEDLDTVMRGGTVVQTGTGGGSGGAKKHKSKSGRRRSGKQAVQLLQQQQQQQQQQQMAGAGSHVHPGHVGGAIIGTSAKMPLQGQQQPIVHARSSHPQMQQQQQQQQQQRGRVESLQMRSLGDPTAHRQSQQDAIRSLYHPSHGNNPSLLDHQRQQQSQAQQASLRQARPSERGGGGMPHGHSQQPPTLTAQVQSGFPVVSPRISARGEGGSAMQPGLMSPPPDQRRDTRQQQQQQQQQQLLEQRLRQQQQQENSLTAIHMQQQQGRNLVGTDQPLTANGHLYLSQQDGDRGDLIFRGNYQLRRHADPGDTEGISGGVMLRGGRQRQEIEYSIGGAAAGGGQQDQNRGSRQQHQLHQHLHEDLPDRRQEQGRGGSVLNDELRWDDRRDHHLGQDRPLEDFHVSDIVSRGLRDDVWGDDGRDLLLPPGIGLGSGRRGVLPQHQDGMAPPRRGKGGRVVDDMHAPQGLYFKALQSQQRQEQEEQRQLRGALDGLLGDVGDIHDTSALFARQQQQPRSTFDHPPRDYP